METPPMTCDVAGETLWTRLSRAAAAISDSSVCSAERARLIMDQRARELAGQQTSSLAPASWLEVVQFEVAGGLYGIEAEYVLEVVPCTTWTRVPGAPEFLAGVTNLRGEILALFDLVKLFQLSATRVAGSHVLVIGHTRAEFGVLANVVHDVIRLPTEHVHGVPDSVRGVVRDFAQGITRDALLVLRGAVLLTDARLVIGHSADPLN